MPASSPQPNASAAFRRALIILAVGLGVLAIAPLLFGVTPYPLNLLAEFGPWDGLVAGRDVAIPPRDYIDLLAQLLPDETVIRREFAAGRFPLWNSHIFMGTPLAAQGNVPVWSPLSLPGWALSIDAAWALQYALQIGIAVLGMGLFLRRRGLATGAALFGAAAFALNGYFLCYLPFRSFTGPLVWLPLWMWALDGAIAPSPRRSHGLSWAALIAIGAAAMLSGNLQIGAYFTGVCFIWTVALALSARGDAIYRKRALAALLVLGAAALVSALNWLPGLEFYAYSGRGQGYAGGFYAGSNYMPPEALLGLAVPTALGHASDGSSVGAPLFNRLYWSQLGGLGYAGLPALLLAGLAVRAPRASLPGGVLRRMAVAAFAGPLAFLLLLATGPGQRIVAASPPLADNDLLRLFFLVSFGISVLGALGLHTFTDDERDARPIRSKATVWLTCGGVAALVGAVYTFWALTPDRAALAAAFGGKLLIPGLVTTYVVFAVIRWPQRSSSPFSIALIILLIVDLGAVGWAELPWGAHGTPAAPMYASDGNSANSQRRGIVSGHWPPSLPDDIPQPVHGFRFAAQGEFLPPNLSAAYGLDDIRGYESLAPARTRMALATLDATYFPGKRNTFPNLYLAPGYAPPMALMGVASFIERYGRTTSRDAAPRVMMASHWETTPAVDALHHLVRADFDPQHTVYIEEELAPATPCASHRLPIVDASHYSGTGGRVTVSSECGGVLVVNEVMVPGWRAFVLSADTVGAPREMRIHHANFLFRGVRLAPGTHAATFRYQPWAFRIGMWVTIGSVLGWCGMLLTRRSRIRG